nr:MAG TPA: hypothetical protein [Caudoviricetes sp.]
MMSYNSAMRSPVTVSGTIYRRLIIWLPVY